MDDRWARLVFATTVAVVVAGIAIAVVVAAQAATPGHFHGAARALNVFAFFTVWSNVVVGVTTALLAVDLDRGSTAFATLRLIGVAAIAVTGVVYHLFLAAPLQGWLAVSDQLLHTVTPILAVGGWLLFGPRGRVSPRVVWLSMLFPLTWFALTLLRGAAIHWYPYAFIDVTTKGYAKAVTNALFVGLLFLGAAAGASALDPRLARRAEQGADG
ncbi:MAG TPA: Pr6Pr family membrane protein [Acidimicrobiales bacterium]|nr:Pr6Pr family membrane protein [Acidimicrobiales bacterium]